MKGRIFQKEDIEKVNWETSPKGSPGVWIRDLVTQETNDRVTVRIVRVDPEGEIIPHTHDVMEVYYILEGEGDALMGEKRQRCSTGTCFVAPAGVTHGLKNTQNLPLQLLCVFTPPLPI
jgi:mannose-6-phosphate isomerase-like protein (cupin superfamily)